MLEDGIHYPRKGDWVPRILIGGFLLFIGFLLLPLFILYGYLLRVVESVYSGDESPPEFEEWGSMLVHGLIAWLISIAYAIPIIVFSIGILPLIGVGAIQDDLWVFAAGAGLLWVFVTFILSIIIGYILPAALINYARTGRAGAAFEFGEITSIAFTMEYLTGIILSVVMLILFGILTSFLAVTIIGILAIPFVTFYGYVVVAYIMATAVRDTTSA